ncbi:Ras family GTPase [Phytophthora palmivora]|uniref:Ras family GTPase n=1 Tax=Phytophthora palmivora TaxID=4796 RepID=A0A2P4YIN7_9STRA|nr:Ras family GTPase [Phytophthora palmivora]
MAATGVIEDSLGEPDVKVILLGDSAVGKSKLVERFMMNEYQPRQARRICSQLLSTFALTLFRKEVDLDGEKGMRTVKVDFWDTAGQERFSSMHPSYYYGATACILVFDVTRKVTYQNLANWYKELREYCENIPCFLVANKIDVDMNVTNKKFKFAETHNLEFNFVSAADGTNVVKVFKEAVEAAYKFKQEGGDFMSDVLDLLGEQSSTLGMTTDFTFHVDF